MKPKNITGTSTKLIFASASLVFLVGCEWGKKDNNNEEMQARAGVTTTACTIADDPLVAQGEVLVSMNGKPVVSTKSFEQHFNRLLDDNPQYKEFLARSPEAKRNALSGLAGQAAIDEFICRNGVDQTEAYLEELNTLIKSQKRMLNLKYFTEGMDVKISDDEVRDSYEKNKDVMPQLLISRGGVKAVGIAFDKEADAKAFAEKVGKGNLSDQAKTSGLSDKVRDFKLVHAGSFGVDPVVRDTIVSFKEFPVVKVVKGKDDKFWVVQATGMEEKSYRPFNEVKDALRGFVEREKSIKMFEEQLEKLKKEYNIVVNESFFGPAQVQDQEALMQELEHMINQEGGAQQAESQPAKVV